MGTGICMCRVDVAQAVRQYGWTLALEPRGMVAMVRYLKESMRKMCEYDDKSLQALTLGFFTGPPLYFVARKLVGGVCFHARPDLGVRQCKIEVMSRSSA